MDAAGAPASIAGFLGFASQIVQSLQLLRKLVERVEDAPDSAKTLLGAASRLERRTEEARRYVVQLSSSSSPNGNGDTAGRGDHPAPAHAAIIPPNLRPMLAVLERYMQACAADMRAVNDLYSNRVTDESRSLRRTWKEVKASLDATFELLAGRIAEQEQNLKQLGIAILSGRPSPPLGSEEKLGDAPAGRRQGGSDQSSSIIAEAPSVIPKKTARASNTVPNHSVQKAEARSIADASSGVDSPSEQNGGSPTPNGNGKKHRAVKKKKPQQQHSNGRFYSCDALGGIDDATEQRREDGALACLFCGRRFAHDDETASRRLGTHLVRDHSFGLCNLNCTFSCRDELLSHLQSFHGWSTSKNNHDDDAGEAMLDRLFLLRNVSPSSSPGRRLNPRMLQLECGSVQPPRGTVVQEREETGLMNLLVLNQILRVVGLEVNMSQQPPATPYPSLDAAAVATDPSESPLAHDLCVALSKLDKLLVPQGADQAANTNENGADASAQATEHGTSVITNGDLVVNVDVEDMVYHAACVQAELGISSDDDILRHEDLYSADQYRIDDLVSQTLPRTPDRHVWRALMRGGSVSPGGGSELHLAKAAAPSIQGLKINHLLAPSTISVQPPSPSGGPGMLLFRSFRDGVRYLGRAHMAASGEKSYVSVMPQLVRAASVLLRQERRQVRQGSWRSDNGGTPQNGRVGMDCSTGSLLEMVEERILPPLTEENMAIFDEQQSEIGTPNGLRSSPEQQRLLWMTDPSLNWWFLSMLVSSPSFRRLVKSGRAFHPKPPPPRRKKSSSSKSQKPPAPETPRLQSYTWACALLSSPRGTPSSTSPPASNGVGLGIRNGNSGGEGDGGREGDRTPTPQTAHLGNGSAGEAVAASWNEQHQRAAGMPPPAPVSLVEADHGSGCSSSSEDGPLVALENERRQQQQDKERRKEEKLQKRQEKGKWVERPLPVINGVQQPTPPATTAGDLDDEDDYESDDADERRQDEEEESRHQERGASDEDDQDVSSGSGEDDDESWDDSSTISD